MNTQEFLAATGIPHASSLTYYISDRVIQPKKVKGRNQFTQEDVEKVIAFRSPGHKQKSLPVSVYDLSLVSTEQISKEYVKRMGVLNALS